MANDRTFSLGASFYSLFPIPFSTCFFLPSKEGEAERRQTQIQPPHHRMRLASSGTRSPVGVPPRLLHRRTNATAQPQAALPGTWLRNGRYPSPPVPVQRASRRPVIVPAGRLPRAARERGYEPRPRAPLSLRHSAVTGDVPYASEISRGPMKGDACQYKRDGAFWAAVGG